MTNKNTGGPAFPLSPYLDGPTQEGMTLRDYFAAKAMQATWPSYHGLSAEWRACAKEAYGMADAMLEARNV